MEEDAVAEKRKIYAACRLDRGCEVAVWNGTRHRSDLVADIGLLERNVRPHPGGSPQVQVRVEVGDGSSSNRHGGVVNRSRHDVGRGWQSQFLGHLGKKLSDDVSTAHQFRQLLFTNAHCLKQSAV